MNVFAKIPSFDKNILRPHNTIVKPHNVITKPHSVSLVTKPRNITIKPHIVVTFRSFVAINLEN